MTDAEATYWANEISNEELDSLADEGLTYLTEQSPVQGEGRGWV
jgi:hypothetical protein